jgi:L-alanine-DL-glutamate epimerase-like enolase superfamily enzyme
MKITSVDVIALEKDPGCLSRPVLCRVNTDQGIYGLGEAGVAIGSGAPAAFAHIKDIAPMIIGMDPWHHEVIWEKLFRQSFWAQGNGAIVMAAISAIDIAVWDIKAKAANVPLYKLLGGKHRDKLRSYASQLQFGWKVDKFIPFKGARGDPAFYGETARKAVEDGYDAVKTYFMRFDEKGDIRPYTASIGNISK